MINILGIIGGIFLIIGAFLLYKGKAFLSIIAYFIADLCWLGMAVVTKSWFGAVSIIIGIVFSLGTWWKMNKGIFVKDLKKGKENELGK
jgi:hypothetical protein